MSTRLAWVSGGTGALGTAICRSLVDQGRTVLAFGHPAEAEKMQAWQAANAEAGYDIAFVLADLSTPQGAEAAVAEARSLSGDPQILVNAAGITRDASLRKLSWEDWKAVMAANLDSVYLLTRAVLDQMLAAGFGRIVNISSVNGQKGQFGQTNYAAAKAGMHGFTMSLAQEVARKGITVNTVSPGYIDSPMIRRVPEAVREGIREGIPVGRFGQPEDIARAVAFLTEDAAGYITGTDLSVNGGLHMG